MKITKIFLGCLLLASVFVGCDITNLNDNPNEPTGDVDYNMNNSRLASVFRTSMPAIEGDDEQRVKSLMVDFYAQMLEGGNFTTKNYQMNEDWQQRLYRRIQSPVAQLNIVIRNLSEESPDLYANSIAVAKIWRVYVQSQGVDCFGPIPFAPYSEVVDNPPYKSVEDSYKEFFKELEEAAALLGKAGSKPIFTASNYDIIYANDVAKWKKFANSLRLRLALRLSEVNSNLCSEQAKAAIAAGVLDSPADNAYLPPKANGDWGQDYNYTMFQISWGGPLMMTTSFEKLLTGIGGFDWPTGVSNKRAALNAGTATPVSTVHPVKVDPRGPVMFDPGYENGDWKGIPAGLPSNEYGTGQYKTVLYSELGILIQAGAPYKARPYDLFLYEEVCFLKAEAALRGFITGNAKEEYEKGVKASFTTWGVSGVTEYLASMDKNQAGTSAKFEDIAGAGNTQLEKIITQKYFALFPDMSMEAWNDKRRLNLPRMDVPVLRDQLLYNNSDKDIKKPANFIRRVQYPQNEIQINKTEYDKGVQLLGGKDNVSTSIWWDKQANYCTSAN